MTQRARNISIYRPALGSVITSTAMKLTYDPAVKPAHISNAEWLNWRWQIKNRLARPEDYSTYFDLTMDELAGFNGSDRLFKIQSTPYYAALADRTDSMDPIRLMIVPRKEEIEPVAGQMEDPLAEQKHSPCARIVHRYPDRALFLVTDTCSVYCRYCLRKHFTGNDQAFIGSKDYATAMDYLRSQTGIREVILSGGDPLTLSDSKLESLLKDLTSIEHIELVRIGTRMPVVCPMRINDELVQRLQKYHPVFLMTHFNHPRELTKEAADALTLFVNHGFPVLNQMVLLRGVNNHPAIVQALSRRLLRLRVKPYYMFQCDPSLGTHHFQTSIEESMQIQNELWGRLSGLAMPNLSIDIPGGGGKVGVVPDFVRNENSQKWSFKGWDGIEADYHNPKTARLIPSNIEKYLAEWNSLKSQRYGASPKYQSSAGPEMQGEL